MNIESATNWYSELSDTNKGRLQGAGIVLLIALIWSII